MRKKMLILLFIAFVIFTINFTTEINIENKTSDRISSEKLYALADMSDHYDIDMNALKGAGGGGGLGALVIYVITELIENSSNATSTIPSTSTNDLDLDNTFNGLSDETIRNLNESNLSKLEILELIDKMTGIKANELRKQKMSLYLGVLEDAYNKIAENNNGVAFYSEDYLDLIQKIGSDNMWLINAIIIEIAIIDKWDIYLVSDPDLYYNKLTKTIIKDRGYSKELWLINSVNKKDWYLNGIYWKVNN